VAARLVGDILLGTVPLYELARFEETSALGGAKFVRGVPTNRYYGKRKTMGNLELRSRLARFRARASEYTIGVTGFVDGGRVWADTRAAPELDGNGRGLKYGVGGGLRVGKGETFVLRADLAWSPDARPLGAYLLAGQLF
jgi:hemolysin activation/secretion protein